MMNGDLKKTCRGESIQGSPSACVVGPRRLGMATVPVCLGEEGSLVVASTLRGLFRSIIFPYLRSRDWSRGLEIFWGGRGIIY